MRLHDVTSAPNPRRVRMFIAEKGLDIECVQVDLRAREHKSAGFLAMHPSGKVPVLELDDGTCIGESVAICRTLEAMHPEPNLLGRDPVEIGLIDMHNRIIEFELWAPLGQAWVNGPVVARLGLVEPIEAARARGAAQVQSMYQRLDRELAVRSYMAGERFTIADISALTAIDFAGALVDLAPDASLTQLWNWHARVSARPSAAA